MKMVFEKVDKIREEDFGFVEKALKSFRSNLGETPESVAKLVEDEKAQAWRVTAKDGNGIFVTQVFREDGELFIWLCGGEGLGKYGEKAIECLCEFAKGIGLERLSAVATLQMGDWLERHCQFSKTGIVMEKEI